MTLGKVPRPIACLDTVPQPSSMTWLGKVPRPSTCLDTVPWPSACLGTMLRSKAMPGHGASA